MSTAELRAALRKRYAQPTWCLLEEVRDRTGFRGKRTADAIAMATWESRGLELHGFELKDTRSDWLRERDTPEKADPIAKYCDRWYLVASKPELVKDGELPPTWGLYVLAGDGGLREAVKAEKRKKPAAIDRGFLAAMMRRATEMSAKLIHPEDLEERCTKRVEELLAAERAAAPYDQRQMADLRETHRKLLEVLGLRTWEASERNLPNIAKAYELVSQPDRKAWYRHELERARVNALEAATRTAELIGKLDELERAAEGEAP